MSALLRSMVIIGPPEAEAEAEAEAEGEVRSEGVLSLTRSLLSRRPRDREREPERLSDRERLRGICDGSLREVVSDCFYIINKWTVCEKNILHHHRNLAITNEAVKYQTHSSSNNNNNSKNEQLTVLKGILTSSSTSNGKKLVFEREARR